jgi:hypothetical protein
MLNNIVGVIARSEATKQSLLKDCFATLAMTLEENSAMSMRLGLLTLFLFSFFLTPQLRAETIHFSIRQLGYDGEATLTMVGPKEYRGHKTVLIVFKANGVNFSDEEDIYVDPVTYKPLFVERNFSLAMFGHGKILEEYISSKREIIITKTEGKHVTREVIHKAGPVDNIYGFIYRYRKEGSFRIGDVLDMTLPTKDLKIYLVKRVVLKIGDKSYDSYYMESRPVRYKIWFDASKHKWPLRITGTISFFNSVMTMTGYEKNETISSK